MPNVATAPRLQSLNLREQVFNMLCEQLASGQLEPGQVYSAAALASELGVSNSPVREAMLTLVNEGLMETVRNRGFRVVPISDDDRREVHEVRSMLEAPAMVRLARAPELVRPHEAALRAQTREIVTAAERGDIVGYLDADLGFIMSLLGLLGNQRLVALLGNLRDRTTLLYGLKLRQEAGHLLNSAREHELILDTILAGDAEGVEELMERHLRNLLED